MSIMSVHRIEVKVTKVECQGGEATVLSPVGEIDLSRSPTLREHLTDALRNAERLVVDLSNVPYMDSSGVATLVEAMQTARRGGTTLILCGMQDKVRSIFEIARLDTVFTIVTNTDEAIAS